MLVNDSSATATTTVFYFAYLNAEHELWNLFEITKHRMFIVHVQHTDTYTAQLRHKHMGDISYDDDDGRTENGMKYVQPSVDGMQEEGK